MTELPLEIHDLPDDERDFHEKVIESIGKRFRGGFTLLNDDVALESMASNERGAELDRMLDKFEQFERKTRARQAEMD